MLFVYVLMAILGAAAMIFSIQNPNPVPVSFLNARLVSLPLSLLILLSVFVGVVFASVSAFAKQIELKLKVRRLEHQITQLSGPAKQPPRVEAPRVDQTATRS